MAASGGAASAAAAARHPAGPGCQPAAAAEAATALPSEVAGTSDLLAETAVAASGSVAAATEIPGWPGSKLASYRDGQRCQTEAQVERQTIPAVRKARLDTPVVAAAPDVDWVEAAVVQHRRWQPAVAAAAAVAEALPDAERGEAPEARVALTRRRS